MKIKCINAKRINQNIIYEGLTVGKEYLVLAVEFWDKSSDFISSFGDFVLYRIEDDYGVVIPYPSKLFTITSPSLPSNWILYRYSDEDFSLLPNMWARPSFWEDFYNDDTRAVEEFKIEKGLMYDNSMS